MNQINLNIWIDNLHINVTKILIKKIAAQVNKL